MTKVTMPEPVAWAHFTEDGLIQIWSRRKDDVESLERLMGKPPNGVITTTQAQAYADAVRREALEAVIQNLEAETAIAREHKAYAAVLALMSQAELIRVQLHKQ